MSTDPRIRQAVRAVILDPEHRMLLVRFAFPARIDAPAHEPRRVVWAAPGGGVEPDESPTDTLRRELHEELGHALHTVGPEVWTRTVLVPFLDGSHDGQHDRYFLVHTPAFDPEPAIGWDALRAEYVTDVRWWRLDEIVASEERFAPIRLASVLADLLNDGPAEHPVDVSH